MQELEDNALLRQYTENNSEAAFAALVSRHINKVYSVALRHTRNPHQAEEITQTVFVMLAKKSRCLGKGVILSGWLYQTARLTAITFLRTEIRRARREQEAHMQTLLNNETESDAWPHIAPLLDTAMAGLNEADRHAVVLRFFDGRSLSDVSAALGTSEEAAKKRVNRAVEKLRLFFKQRGVALPAAVLTAAISANAVQAAPVGLAKAVSVIAIAQGATASGSVIAMVKGLLKPVFTASAGALAALTPLLGSVFFHLKAEIESAKSPRERQFIVHMIWLRFTVALLAMAVPIVMGMMMPSFVKQPGVIEFGFAAFCFCGAVEVAARTVYFQRRRREIQIQEGTWEELPHGQMSDSAGLLEDLRDSTSKANRYAAIAALFGLVACVIFTATLMWRAMSSGYWIASMLILLWFGVASLRWICNWRHRPRFVFDLQFGSVMKPVVFFAMMSLVLFDLSWARGRLPLSLEWTIVINLLVVLIYALLLRFLARVHRPIGTPAGTTSPST